MKSTLLTLVCILSTGIQDPHYPFRRDSYKHSTLSMEGRYKLGQLFQDMSPKGVDADHTIYHNLIIILQKYLNPKSFFYFRLTDRRSVRDQQLGSILRRSWNDNRRGWISSLPLPGSRPRQRRAVSGDSRGTSKRRCGSRR